MIKKIRQIKIPYNNSYLFGVLHSTTVPENNTITIYFHSYGTYKEETSYLFSTLAKRMYFVDSLLFDYYGCGDSPGVFEEVTLTTIKQNVQAVLSFVNYLYPSYKVLVVAKGISIPILNELSCDYNLSGMIIIGDIKNFKFPQVELSQEILNIWRTDGKIEFGYLLNRVNIEDRNQILNWEERVGYLYRSESISYEMINQLNGQNQIIDFDKISIPILHFCEKTEISKSNGYSFVLIEKEKEDSRYISPESIDEIVINSLKWITTITK